MTTDARRTWIIAGSLAALLAVLGAVFAVTREPAGDGTASIPELSTSGASSSVTKAMEAIPAAGVAAATETRGLKPLPYVLDRGTKVFALTTKPVRWPIAPGVEVTAWSYDGMVPGPLIRVTEGDRVRIVLKNELPEPTTIHWHGIEVPNGMDGIPGVTQDPVLPGESFTYEFVAKPSGTFWYHSHFDSDKQISIGVSGAFIIDPKGGEKRPDIDETLMFNEWRVIDGQTYTAMPATGMDGNYFTINGKSYPDTADIEAKVGQRVRLRLIGSGQMAHPIHLHGFSFRIVATDGRPVPAAAQLVKDTVNVSPGERYDIEFVPDRPGKWMLHCHIPHHTTNEHEEPGGLMLMVNVSAE